MSSINRGSVKLFAAVVGGSALVAFGAMSVEIAQQGSGQDATASSKASVDAVAPPTTTTETVVASFDKVVPALTGKPAEPSGESPNRIP